MNRKPFLKSALAAIVLLSTPAWAASEAAPKEIAETIHAEAPYGQATASALFLTAYTATLWTDAPQWSMTQPFALTIRYAMNFDTDELVSRTVKEMQHVDPQFQASPEMIGALGKAFAPVKPGDRITALYLPGKPVAFYKNGAMTGQIATPGFADDFFGIWLSPKTSDASMRQALLHLK